MSVNVKHHPLRVERELRGWSQAKVAEALGTSVRSLARWEKGEVLPQPFYRERLCDLFGKNAQELGIISRPDAQSPSVEIPHDERWLSTLLGNSHPQLEPVAQSPVVSVLTEQAVPARPASGPRLDWGEALDVHSFYGREEELALLSQWVVEERCRVVSVLGMGGSGKSALAVTLMHQVAAQFEVVIWRSLRDAPACSALVEECLQVLAPQQLRDLPDSLEGRLRRLLEQLRARRVLLVLDNLEMLLEEGEGTGRMRASFEGYAHLLRRVGETAHQSCLLLTSREKPVDLVPLEGRHVPVRALRLAGLDAEAGAQLLAEEEVVGTPQDQVRLVEGYRGNPLALKIVAQTITELFGGEIAPFLEQGEVVFGGVRELLDEQFVRLSALEQSVFSWLAILREPVSLEQLLSAISPSRAPEQVLEALDGLSRRSLIERGQRAGSFTLQSVVLEYATARLIAEASREIEQGRLARLIAYGLCQAQVKDYVRQAQERLLVVPLLSQLQSMSQGHADLQAHLLWLLDDLRGWSQPSQGYGPANLVALLRVLRGNLRGLDLSQLSLRSVYLQGVEMQDAIFTGAALQDCVFTETFDAILAVAISRSGQYWAAASMQGEVRVWEARSQALHLLWQVNTDITYALAFSPDGRHLVSGSWDGSIKLWNIESGGLLWSGWQTNNITSGAIDPDGSLLATSGNDATVQLWDIQSGTHLETLSLPDPVFVVTWSPDGRLLASGGLDGQIRLWEIQRTKPATCVQTLTGHTAGVIGLSFVPDGSLLASGSWDRTVKLWEVGEAGSLHLLQTLVGHTERVTRVAWSPDGRTLASGGHDPTVLLWEIEKASARAALHGHTAEVIGLAFTPDSRSLLSGSEDGTLRLWDVASGQCLRVMQGYTASLFALDWSPDGTHVVSGGMDTLITIWGVAGREGGMQPRVLHGHHAVVYGVGWSPDSHWLASSGWDNVICLWDPTTGTRLEQQRDPDHPDTFFFGVAWNPDGQRLASGTFAHGVLVWDVAARSHSWVGRELPTLIRCVAWSPDGTRLAGGGGVDGQVYLWNASDGSLLDRLAGHHGGVTSVAWSPDGMLLASGGGSSDSGELFVWEAQRGEPHPTWGAGNRGLAEHPGVISAVTWSPSGERLISGGSDGRLRWWEVDSGDCLRVREAHQGTVQALKVSPDGSRLASCGDDGAIMLWDLESGEPLQTLRRDRPYERMNITGIRGLTEAQKASLRALGAFEETSRDE